MMTIIHDMKYLIMWRLVFYGSAARHSRPNAPTTRGAPERQVKPSVTSHNSLSTTKPACGTAKQPAWPSA